jgi:hypothetical protein
MDAEQIQAERARVEGLLDGQVTWGEWVYEGGGEIRAIPTEPHEDDVDGQYALVAQVMAIPRGDGNLLAAAPSLAHSLLPALDALAAAQTDIEGAHRLIDQRTQIVRHLPGEPETMTWRVDALTHLAEKYRGSLTTMTAEAREWRDRARAAEARVTALEEAVDAAIQCETDLLEVYQRRTSLSTLDLAVADLKRDSLPKLKAARTALTGGES